MTRGTIEGGTPFERAVRVAGALAEMGIPRLRVRSSSGIDQELAARETDLPGELLRLPVGGSLEAPGLRIVILRDSLEWECVDAAAAQALGGA